MSPAAQRAYEAITTNSTAQSKLKAAIRKADAHEHDTPRGAAFQKARAALMAAEVRQIETDITEAQAVHNFTENYGQ